MQPPAPCRADHELKGRSGSNPVALASLMDDCFLAAERVGPEGRVIGVDIPPRWWNGPAPTRSRAGWPTSSSGWAKSRPCRWPTASRTSSNCVLNLSANRPRVLAETTQDLVSDRPMPIAKGVAGRLPPGPDRRVRGRPRRRRVHEHQRRKQRYPSEHILADPLRRQPAREAEVHAFVESIHGGTICATKPEGAG